MKCLIIIKRVGTLISPTVIGPDLSCVCSLVPRYYVTFYFADVILKITTGCDSVLTGVLVHVTGCYSIVAIFSDGTSPTSDVVKIENMHLSTGARESKSAPSPQSSGSPLQRLLLHSPIRQTSSVDNLSGRSSTGASKTVGSLRRLPEASETVGSLQCATLHYTAECNGVSGGTWQPYSRHSVELCSRKLDVNDKYVGQQKWTVHDKGTVNNTMNGVVGDSCMTQTHSRSGPMMTFHDTRVVNTSLFQRCAPKRLMRSSLSGATVPKHLCNWHVDSRDTAARVLNLSSKSSNSSKDSSVTCSSVTTASSQHETRTPVKRPQEGRCLAAEPRTTAAWRCYNSPRRVPVTAWTVSDVYAFVLSLPHGALYAQVSAASSPTTVSS